MSSTNPSTNTPFVPESIHFDFPSGNAIHLLDHQTNLPVGRDPEWNRSGRDEFAAFVRSSRLKIRVVFRGDPSMNGSHTIGADGMPIQIEERTVTLTFDPTTSLSQAEIFEAENNLPDVIGVHQLKLNWYIREQTEARDRPHLGETIHRVGTSWQSLAVAPTGETELQKQVYKPLMEWTCEWAAGLNDEKEICDAIFRNIPSSGLCYGIYAKDISDLLLKRGGMCGVWYEVFQQMTQCQGIFVYRRQYFVDWRVLSNGEAYWCAIVIKNGGLNQTNPTHPPSIFHDYDGAFPIPTGQAIQPNTVTEARYRFWGLPRHWYDGHCINFLVYQGTLYLYDVCFGMGSLQISAPLPPNDLSTPMGGASLEPFKTVYLNTAIDYMLGSIQNGNKLIQTLRVFPDGPPIQNGITIPTNNIPTTFAGVDGLTFRWGE